MGMRRAVRVRKVTLRREFSMQKSMGMAGLSILCALHILH